MVLLIAVLGLVFGSFLSAVTYRLPKGESFTKGRSRCPNCRKKIRWFDNIPLVSYLVLRGRCRDCNKPVSYRYPLIEAITAVGFVSVYLLHQQGLAIAVDFGALTLPYYLFLFLISLSILVIDLEEMIIPDSLVFLGFLVTILFLITFDSGDVFGRLFAGFMSATALLTVNLLTKGKGMGLGDVKLATLFGLALGPSLTVAWLFLSFLTGALVGIILILTKKASFGRPIAFGPFMVVAFLATLFWGKEIVSLLRLFN